MGNKISGRSAVTESGTASVTHQVIIHNASANTFHMGIGKSDSSAKIKVRAKSTGPRNSGKSLVIFLFKAYRFGLREA